MSTEILDQPGPIAPSPAVPAGYITFEQYLTIGEDTQILEWVDGEVIKMAPAAQRHQEILLFLLHTVGLYVELHDLGRIVSAPFAMKLAAQKRGREPDILFVKRERLDLLKDTFLDGPADLAIEIISPESVGPDRGEKFIEYEEAGIPEYWLVDFTRRQAEFNELGEDGLYHLADTRDGIYRSKALGGFYLRIDWLWQMPAPTIEALRELKLLG
ncbi:MAG: Uma2 family endonuclease [Pyrinomonadaceae bacterium]